MWMSEPTPETKTSIVLLSLSSVRPSGTLNASGMSIHVNWAAEISGRRKIKQLQTKLPRTAATEMKLLNVFDRPVKSTITAAEQSGRSSTYQGSELFMSI